MITDSIIMRIATATWIISEAEKLQGRVLDDADCARLAELHGRLEQLKRETP